MPAEKQKLKSSKPLMEKRRRARINDSLIQLKTLVLNALNKNNSRHSKLEKADILEMTVRYLRTIQRQQISASAHADPSVLVQYRSGYAECVGEVTRYLGANSTTGDGAPELRTRLVGHLADLTTGQPQTRTTPSPSLPQQQQSPVFQLAQTWYQQESPHMATVEGAMTIETAPSMSIITSRQPTTTPAQRSAAQPEGAKTENSLTTPVYNTNNVPRGQMSHTVVRAQSPTLTNSSQVVQSVPLEVTGSLPSGEITLVIPQQALSNGQLPTHLIPVYAPPAVPAVLTHKSSTNIQSGTGQSFHVSMSSPRLAATVPALSPTGPQSSMTIPAQHALVAQPPISAQVAYCVPVQQTQLSPVREVSTRCPQRIQRAREPVAPDVRQCLASNDPMWRPW